MTPSEFRRNKNEKPAGLSFSATDVNHYLDIIYKNKICNLEEITSKIDQNIEISIDFEKREKRFTKPF